MPPKPPPGRPAPPPPSDDEDDDVGPPPSDDDSDVGPPPSDDDSDVGPPPSDDYDDDEDEDDDDVPPPSDNEDEEEDDVGPPPSDDESDAPPPPSSAGGTPPPSPSVSAKSSDRGSVISSPPLSEDGSMPPPTDDEDNLSTVSSNPPTPPAAIAKKPPMPPASTRRNNSTSSTDLNNLMKKSSQSFGASSNAVASAKASDIDMDILSAGFKPAKNLLDVNAPDSRRSSVAISSNNNNNNSYNNNYNNTVSTNTINSNPDMNKRGSVSIRSSISTPLPLTLTRRQLSAEESFDILDRSLKQGFVELLGKFEGDLFEKLFVKAERNYFFVRSEFGEDMVLDMLEKIFVFEDVEDPACFVVEAKQQVMIFKMRSFEERIKLLSRLPQKVFEAPDDDDVNYNDIAYGMIEEQKLIDQQKLKPKPNPAYVYPDDDEESAVAKKPKRKKGQSVEDLLEGSSQMGGGGSSVNNQSINNRKMDKMFFSSSQNQNDTLLAYNAKSVRNPQYRKELISERIKQPVISVRRVKMLTKWINGLWLTTTGKDGREVTEKVWPTVVTINSLNKDFCNGILLSRIVKVLIPYTTVMGKDGKEVKQRTEFLHLNGKTVAPKAALENLDKVLGLILRSKSVNKSRIPAPKEILNGSTSKIAILLHELFDVYERERLYRKAVPVLRWFNTILRQYDLRLSEDIFTENGDVGSIWSHFQSGLALFCVIFHLFGQNTIGNGVNTMAIDPFRIFSRPTSVSEFRQNLIYVFSLLRLLNVEVIWEFDDWITFPDTEFCLLQLSYVYDVLKNKQCNLPPAQGSLAGITSGPNGEPRVVGLHFADSVVSDMYALPKMTRGVLLGAGEDALALLPIDTAGRDRGKKNRPDSAPSPNYFSDVIPQGLVSANVKVVHQALQLKKREVVSELSHGWQSSSLIEAISLKETKKDRAQLSILSQHNSERRKSVIGSARKAKLDNLDEAINAFIVNHQVDMEDAFSNKNKQSTVELDDMMRVLEEHMLNSNIEMSSLEERLTDRYLELEQLASEITEDEYLAEFDELENERIRLEEEKSKLQDHFQNRLLSIKTRQLEIQARADAQKEMLSSGLNPFSDGRGGGVVEAKESQSMDGGRSIASNSTRQSGLKGGLKSRKADEKTVDGKLLEKGWINLIAKSNFMNHHLKHQELKSKKDLTSQWEPSKYKQQTAVKAGTKQQSQYQNEENNRPNQYYNAQSKQGGGLGGASTVDKSFLNLSSNAPSFDEYGLSSLDTELARNDPTYSMFNRFRFRLLEISNKWNESKLEKPREPVYGSAPKSVSFQDLIALPSSGKVGDYRVAIRDEELNQMAYEDKRRRSWYKQVAVSLQLSSAASATAYQNNAGSSSSSSTDGKTPTQVAQSAFSQAPKSKSTTSTISNAANNNNYNNNNNNNSSSIDGYGKSESSSTNPNNNNNNISSPDGRNHYTQIKPSLPHFNVKRSNNNIINNNSNNDNSYSKIQNNGQGYVNQDMQQQQQDSLGYDGGYDDTTALDDVSNTGTGDNLSTFEIQTAIRWLGMKRPLILCDRKNQEFWFLVEKSGTPKKPNFTFMWFVDESLSTPAGSVTLDFCREASQHPQDSTIFCLSLIESSKALKSTGGRAKLALKCVGAGECFKYLQTLNLILRAMSLGLLANL